ncbi:hypothetical protein Gpo141_00004693 [Globisporangium polare]
MKPVTTVALALVLTAAAIPAPALARPEYRSRIPNGFNVPNVPAVGHTDPQGSSGSLNVFGKAFSSAGSKWTTTLCQADSDGDGQTNGQELGDPCCGWSTSSSAPQRDSGLSDPSHASSTANASQWSDVNCTGVEPMAGSGASAQTHQTALSTALAMLLGLAMGALVAARG